MPLSVWSEIVMSVGCDAMSRRQSNEACRCANESHIEKVPLQAPFFLSNLYRP
ncbi:MAG: hypothetical protein ACI81O_002628 [Cyclobacteriaceae bacterium]|jgi:hypothetical protein